jgi:hypothetical protein
MLFYKLMYVIWADSTVTIVGHGSELGGGTTLSAFQKTITVGKNCNKYLNCISAPSVTQKCSKMLWMNIIYFSPSEKSVQITFKNWQLCMLNDKCDPINILHRLLITHKHYFKAFVLQVVPDWEVVWVVWVAHTHFSTEKPVFVAQKDIFWTHCCTQAESPNCKNCSEFQFILKV